MRAPRNTRSAKAPHSRRQPTRFPVPYDVAAGLDRHRELVAAGTLVPEWVEQTPGATRGVRFGKWRWWLVSTLGVVAVISLSWPNARPSPDSPAAPGVAKERSQEPLPPTRQASLRSAAPHPEASGELARSTGEGSLGPGKHTAGQVDDAPQSRAHGAAQAQPNLPKPRAQPHRSERVPGTPPRRKQSPETSGLPSAELPDQTSLAHGESAGVDPRKAAESQDDLTTQRAAPPPAVPAAAAQQDREEMQQVARAEQLLATRPAETLRLVRAGETQYPRGYFRQERRYLEVMALLALGRHSEAVAYAHWFLRDYPAGPYRLKIQLALRQQQPE